MKATAEYAEILTLLASLSVSDKLQMVSFLRALKESGDNSRPPAFSQETEKR